jgi:hypothetical protein
MIGPQWVAAILLGPSLALNIVLIRSRPSGSRVASDSRVIDVDRAPAGRTMDGGGADAPRKRATRGDPACQRRLDAAREGLERAADELRRVMPARRLFQVGAPNEIAQRRVSAVLARLLTDEAGAIPAHTVECRDEVCRLSVLRPEKESEGSGWMLRLQRSADLRAYVVGGIDFEGGGSLKDPVTAEALRRQDAYLRLASADGAPAAPRERDEADGR